MSDIVKYNILNPISNNKKPFYKNNFLYIPSIGKYNYFLEASLQNEYGGVDYYLLFGKTKFNEHCRKCITDNYGRVKINIKGSIKDYVKEECERYGNINVDYVESADDYDVFTIYS